MVRPLRIEYPGAVYHLHSRGNKKLPIFEDNIDRLIFIEKLISTIQLRNWICHAYCLMDNHYHLLIETPEGNLSDGMRDFNSGYVQAYNNYHDTSGTMFGGRFTSHLIEKEHYLYEVQRYIVLNPVRAGMVVDPKDYIWSSYRATAGFDQVPEWLIVEDILLNFAETKREAQKKYIEFVKDGFKKESPFENLRGMVLGSLQFCHEISRGHDENIEGISKKNRIIGRLSLNEIFCDIRSRKERDAMIVAARKTFGYSVGDIAHYLRISHSTISKISRGKD